MSNDGFCGVSVVINNYNYGAYIAEAIESVLAQTYEKFELIIVDDGSTDNSRDVINSFSDSRIVKIFKANGGQLSAFNAGICAAKGEIICFLDSDDILPCDYLSTAVNFFDTHANIDFLFFPVNYFGAKSGQSPEQTTPYFWGNHGFCAAYLHKWIGNPTSALAIRKNLLDKFMPLLELEPKWKTRADDILIMGSDIAGGEKYYLPTPQVQYRVHGKNGFYGRTFSSAEYTAMKQAKDELAAVIINKLQLAPCQLLEKELHSPARPTNMIFLRSCLRMILLGLKKHTIATIKSSFRCFYLLFSSNNNGNFSK